MTVNVTMLAPGLNYTTVLGNSGTTYYSDSTGVVANVLPGDIASLQAAGFQIIGVGYGSFRARMLDARNIDGSALAAAASSGKFGYAVTLGTSGNLVSEAANNNTKTDSVMWELTIPTAFKSGSSPSIIVNGNHVIGAGTLTTHTLAVHAYVANDDGTQSADIVTTGAQNTLAAAGDTTFVTSSALVQAGGKIIVEAVVVLTETASSNVTYKLNSMRFA